MVRRIVLLRAIRWGFGPISILVLMARPNGLLAVFVGVSLAVWCTWAVLSARAYVALWRDTPQRARWALFQLTVAWPLVARSVGLWTDGNSAAIKTIVANPSGLRVYLMLDKAASLAALENHRQMLSRSLRLRSVELIGMVGNEVELRCISRDLLESPIGEAFWEAASSDVSSGEIRVACDEFGMEYRMPIAHTLVCGVTGSGKGSVLWAVVRAFLPAQTIGHVEIWGIDPKHTELARARGILAGVVACSASEIADVLAQLVLRMRARQNSGFRTFVASGDNPWLVLIVDEFSSLALAATREEQKVIDESLTAIMTQGRSVGVVVYGFVQQPTKLAVGPWRGQFVVRIALRVESASDAELALGEGSVSKGASPHQIKRATAADGYRTAGVGYAIDNSGAVARIRFPYTADEQIERLMSGATNGDR